MKKRVEPGPEPGREHVVRPDEHREERDADGRERDRLVAEDRLAREDRDDLRDHPEDGQHHDVDLGVPEEPEHVLVEHDAPALRGDEEMRADGRSSSSSVTAAEIAGSATSSRIAYVSIAQTKSGMRIHVMPGARMLWIVTMKLIAPRSDDEREDVDREDPVVLAVARARQRHRLGQRRIRPPAGVRARRPSRTSSSQSTSPPRRKSQYESALRRGNAMSRAPIISGTRKLPKPARIGTTTRKIIVVPCIVSDLVVRVLRQQLLARASRAATRMRSARMPPSDEEDERGRDVQDPDPLVVDGDEPARHAAVLPADGIGGFGV